MTHEIAALRRIPPFQVRSGFLDPADHGALLAWVLTREADFVPSKLGAGRVDPAMRNSLTLRTPDFRPWRRLFRQRLRALIPEVCGDLGVVPFEAGKIEVQLLAYRDGAFYRRHRDISRREDRPGLRVLSCVYYFHSEPKAYSGGALRLYPIEGGAEDFIDLEPQQNGLLLFPAWAPHEARTVHCPSGRFADSRFAINIWIHLAEAQ